MTVAELLATLEDVDPSTEVRLMTQSNYPFENAVVGVWTPDEDGDEDGDEFIPADGNDFGHASREPISVVYIVEGRQLGYGSRDAWAK